MNNWQWKKKEALQEQLKFFGAKKQEFISIYAKKPKVRVKVKPNPDNSRVTNVNYNDSRTAYIDRQIDILRQQGVMRGGLYAQIASTQSALLLQERQSYEMMARQQAALGSINYCGAAGGLGVANGLLGGLIGGNK